MKIVLLVPLVIVIAIVLVFIISEYSISQNHQPRIIGYSCYPVEEAIIRGNYIDYNSMSCPFTSIAIDNPSIFYRKNVVPNSSFSTVAAINLDSSCDKLLDSTYPFQIYSAEHVKLYRDEQLKVYWCLANYVL
ncbi:MAG: hypothetical protein IPJ89_01600 [Candidatus Iainarchaeum archaeon]|uniref:Uncharacterized protein n=1 Tax=Candidatus Iainarchaeum sp. TaxID=3101447 RepID=A0A7T9DKD5_9ARCH|nr:MAG: hypothetical protein IPJ89_01600 [Candidatus Diapherotrites archaeon]